MVVDSRRRTLRVAGTASRSAFTYLKARQIPDGSWAYAAGDTRPPICEDHIGQTALALRALQLYAPKTDKAAYEKAILLAAKWIAKAEPKTHVDRIWRLFGLAWAAKDKEAIRKGVRDLVTLQRPDGGWLDFPSMESNAYTTGQTLVALQTAGLPLSDSAYQRGVQFLLQTQLEDGSWYVQTRALGFQPYFESGFPHGVDQFLSAAATSWATMALALASETASSTLAGRAP
jgi:squalene cyclase